MNLPNLAAMKKSYHPVSRVKSYKLTLKRGPGKGAGSREGKRIAE
jgi:hypothetical protein